MLRAVCQFWPELEEGRSRIVAPSPCPYGTKVPDTVCGIGHWEAARSIADWRVHTHPYVSRETLSADNETYSLVPSIASKSSLSFFGSFSSWTLWRAGGTSFCTAMFTTPPSRMISPTM